MKDSKNYEQLKNLFKKFFLKKRFLSRLNHNSRSFILNRGRYVVKNIEADDTLLIERLKKFYILCDINFEGNKDSVWSGIFNQLQGEIHSAFINGDNKKIADILRNPGKYNLFYGFENLCRDLINSKRLEDILEPEMAMDSLLSFCEATGVIAMSNPESLRIKKTIDPEKAIQLLEKELGFELCFPNPFEGEYGIETSKGVISYRAVQALYQAWKISQIVKGIVNPAILEIGGGLGRTAYYCHLLGIRDYTIVDIPMSLLSQGDFLGRVLPERDLFLAGEKVDSDDSKIKLIHSKAFFSSDKKYDLIINVDSLTELDINIAKQYLGKIKEVGNYFLSINHEINSFSVNSIWKETPGIKKIYRAPYWLRRGYVEELFQKDLETQNA